MTPFALRIIFILALLTTSGFGQQTLPTPKKDPFAGFHSSLDDRPGMPSQGSSSVFDTPSSMPAASSANKAGGLILDGRWDAPLSLSAGGPAMQRKELRALLSGFVEPGKDTGAFPKKRIYRQVTYLLPLASTKAQMGLAGKLSSGGKTAVVGFPDGLKFVEFTPEAGRAFTVRLLKDGADQVVSVEFVASSANALPLPPEPLPPPARHFNGVTYDFVPEGIMGSGGSTQESWNMSDYVLISTRGGPKAADLYIPKPMVSLILHCLDRS